MDHNQKTFYGLPPEIKFCKRCVISNQRPSSTVEFKNEKGEIKNVINFSEDDICSDCVYQQEKESNINWEVREESLRELLGRFRSKDGSYDVIVPGSGGKFSAYTSHTLKYKYGMNPLTVTWAPHLFTSIGLKNFHAWTHSGGLDNILYTPNGRLHREMTRNSFHNLLHPFQPFIAGLKIIGPTMAQRFDVKLVMYGESPAEYGNAIERCSNSIMNMDFFSTEEPLAMKFGGVSVSEYISRGKYTFDDFFPYIAPEQQNLVDLGIEAHYLGSYVKLSAEKCHSYAVKNTGLHLNHGRIQGTYSEFSNLDDKIGPFHYLTTLIKFGIGRSTYDAARDIRSGRISREEAVELVNKYDTEFPTKYLKDFLEYIETSEEEFHKVIDEHRSPHIWKLNYDGSWSLRCPVI